MIERDKLMQIRRVAERVGDVSPKTIERWVREGMFPKPDRFGRARRWWASDVEAWITKRKQQHEEASHGGSLSDARNGAR